MKLHLLFKYISPQKQNPVKYDIPPTSALGWLHCSSGEK